MSKLDLKPTLKPVQNYYAALRPFEDLGVSHEGAAKLCSHDLLNHCARQHDWTLVPEFELRRPRQHPLRVDGALLDNFRLTLDFWEAKDMQDDLQKAALKKFDLGYSGECQHQYLCAEIKSRQAHGEMTDSLFL